MPFNMAVAGGGSRSFTLAAITSEDLALNYNVADALLAQFGQVSQAGDRIRLTLGGVNLIASSSTDYAIDADSLHDEANLTITFTTGCLLSGRGGSGGTGGDGERDPELPPTDTSTVGLPGNAGGTAIRYGCRTTILGVGTIALGYGGGGGGGGAGLGPSGGGGGGGGGAPLGLGGAGGLAITSGTNGNPGTNATVVDNGVGGASVNSSGAGGRGADSGTTATSGNPGSVAGGVFGVNGNAISTQGFSYSHSAGIAIVGAIV